MRSPERDHVAILNFAGIEWADAAPTCIADHEYAPEGGAPVECYFRDVRKRLIERLGEYPIAVGCVAWLTDREVLAALARVRSALVIQKEDFLRPDSGRLHRRDLRAAYAKIHGLRVDELPGPLPIMSVASGAQQEQFGVRCVGYAKRGSDIAVPRMHHKFIVFGVPDSGRYADDAEAAA